MFIVGRLFKSLAIIQKAPNMRRVPSRGCPDMGGRPVRAKASTCSVETAPVSSPKVSLWFRRAAFALLLQSPTILTCQSEANAGNSLAKTSGTKADGGLFRDLGLLELCPPMRSR